MKLKDFIYQLQSIYDDSKDNGHGIEPEIDFYIMSHDLTVGKYEINVSRWLGCGCAIGAIIDMYLDED